MGKSSPARVHHMSAPRGMLGKNGETFPARIPRWALMWWMHAGGKGRRRSARRLGSVRSAPIPRFSLFRGAGLFFFANGIPGNQQVPPRHPDWYFLGPETRSHPPPPPHPVQWLCAPAFVKGAPPPFPPSHTWVWVKGGKSQ